MTEENKDSIPPKLRLSLEPQAAKTDAAAEPDSKPAAKPAPQAAAEEATAAPVKPSLRLRRPDAEPDAKAECQTPGTPAATPEPEPAKPEPIEPESAKPEPEPAKPEPFESEPAKPESTEPAVAQAFDPENPFRGAAAAPDPQGPAPTPPELPNQPLANHGDATPQRAPAARDDNHDHKKHKGLLPSILIIFSLILVLGACAYGLYYVLLMPSEDTPSEVPAAAASIESEQTGAKESGSLLSQPIAKAREVVSEMQDPERAWSEESAPAPAPPAVPPAAPPPAPQSAAPSSREQAAAQPAEVAAPAPTVSPPSVDAFQTSEVSAFLQKAHIGGVRMGERPKLLLNGQSYDQGELIDPATGLRFIGLRDKKLAFQDAQGIVYIKSF